jgi:hypothetical protein
MYAANPSDRLIAANLPNGGDRDHGPRFWQWAQRIMEKIDGRFPSGGAPMPIDDELEKSEAAAEIREEAERTFQKSLALAGIAGAISRIPGIGNAINEMLTQLALRRTHERMSAMVDEMTRHIRKLREENINRDWFRGEEFQTLLFEAMQQLYTTHDKQKIEMLGRALVNSGASDFTADVRKELFVQLIRDLTPLHIAMLRQLLPIPTADAVRQPPFGGAKGETVEKMLWRSRPSVQGKGSDLLILQMLAASGLVEETLKPAAIREFRFSRQEPSMSEAKRALVDYFKELHKPPKRYFELSELGRDFLRFVGIPSQDAVPD